MKTVYLASAYSSGSNDFCKEYRLLLVQEFLAMFAKSPMSTKYSLYSPIAQWAPIASLYSLPHEHEFWNATDNLEISRRDELWILNTTDWTKSKGVYKDVLKAIEFGKRYRLADLTKNLRQPRIMDCHNVLSIFEDAFK